MVVNQGLLSLSPEIPIRHPRRVGSWQVAATGAGAQLGECIFEHHKLKDTVSVMFQIYRENRVFDNQH